MKTTDNYKGSMHELIAMTDFLELMGYDINDLTFQEGVNLVSKLKRVISDFPTTRDQ